MMDRESYIRGKGLFCPFCGSDDIGGGFVNIETGEASQEMSCTRCNGRWQDLYKLVDLISNLKEE